MLKEFLHNTAIPLRVRKKLGKLLRVPNDVHYSAVLFENTYAGVTGSHLDNKVYLYGSHEPASIRFMRAVLQLQRKAGKSPVYLDVGTNSGAHLISISSLADAAYGFEPWEPIRNRAIANVQRNNLPHVNVIGVGLGQQDAVLPFALPVDGNHGTGSFHRQDNTSNTMLEVKCGDRFMSERNIIPTLIKIDTEGFERPVLEGLAQTIRTHKPVVVFEYSSASRPDFANDGLMVKTFGEGYTFYGIKPSREYPKVELLRYNKRYENLVAWPDSGPTIFEALGLIH